MNDPKLDLVLLWHMHQPDFRDQASGEFRQPWVYLHAIKDYSDMAAHLEAHPGVRAVVNFTPVLLDQLEDYADQFATGAFRDPLLRLLARPDPFAPDPSERRLILDSCFKANRAKLIESYPAYRGLADLLQLARDQGATGPDYLSPQYLADLLTWYHLAWVGETVRRADPLATRLLVKAQGFSGEDRRQLLALIGREVAQVIPRYRALAERNQIELTTSPSRHPIGPLLISFESAREASPDVPLPAAPRYPGGHARAQAHVRAARESHERRFGRPPRGMWPAEGAISTEFAAQLAGHGCEWLASGEGVLLNSLQRQGESLPERARFLYRPYRVGTLAPLTAFFRDDRLSDLIGFEYAKWHSDEAAANFIEALEAIRTAGHSGGRPVVSVILDGENAWEHYPYNGFYFLDSLYAALEAHASIETTTFAALIDEGREAAALPSLVAGSWVYGNFTTWIGSPDKNRAWDLLCAAKQRYDEVMERGGLPASQREAAERQLADCEASDWCWWFGDYNPPESVLAFDALYRAKLSNLYRLLGLEAPAELGVPISQGGTQAGGTEGAMRRAS
jgi:alpha-amylase/alpha-mannosidase (GH57 family)